MNAQLVSSLVQIINSLTEEERESLENQHKTELQYLHKFLRNYELILIDKSTSEKAVKLIVDYRLSHELLISNALITATAIALKIPLLSKN